MDVVLLSRVQFTLTIMFHYLFPPLSIGLGLLLVFIEGLSLKTKNPLYEKMARFWTKVFAVNFAVGVASGIVMEFEFGTNWAAYSRFVGDVFGSALASEGIFAFFLESGFLALLVFGWDRIPKKLHFFSTCMVALGATFSSVWIVVANSWMQTPAGYHIVGQYPHARAEITDFWAMVFNPSAMVRLGHVLIGAYVLAAMFMMSISAFYLLKKRHVEFARASFTVALALGTVASCMTAITGHSSAETAARYQPAKLAAFEGHYKTGPADLYLFGLPDNKTGEVKYGVKVPGGLSFLVHQDFQKPVPGLDQFAPQDRPKVGFVFQTYHLMVAIGVAFIGMTLLASYLRWKGRLWEQTWLLRLFVVAVVPAYVANQVGWISAEVGRQPWIVYGLMRTDAAVSKAITAQMVLGSILMFTAIYGALLALYLFVMDRKIQHGPDEDGAGEVIGGRPVPILPERDPRPRPAAVPTPAAPALSRAEAKEAHP
jgi:cytochrome d ubiquinol oxidase subunit I